MNPECKGCMFRSKNAAFPCCDYFTLTGKLRGCAAGAGCTRKVIGKKLHQSWSKTVPKDVPKPKRVLLTDQEKRDRHNALHKAERAKKKAAKPLDRGESIEMR